MIPTGQEPTWRAFIHSICEEPLDDTPRLIFADWLEEHGQDGVAEFIRSECARAALPRAEKRFKKYREMAEKASRWRSEHGGQWYVDLMSNFSQHSRLVRPRAWGRGFPTEVEVWHSGYPDLSTWYKENWPSLGAALTQTIPVERVLFGWFDKTQKWNGALAFARRAAGFRPALTS